MPAYPIKMEKMLAGQRSPRNPLLVEVMCDDGYMDARGMGVRRQDRSLVCGRDEQKGRARRSRL
jgi:predicted HTH transcriptional regulator